VKQPSTQPVGFTPQQDIAKLAPAVASPNLKEPIALSGSPADENTFSAINDRPPLKQPEFEQPEFETPSSIDSVPAFKAPTRGSSIYVSKPGDSFWSIATAQYGDGRLFDALFCWNRGRVKNFEDLPVETRLEIPAKIELVRRWPERCPQDQAPSQSQAFNDQTVADYDATLTGRLYTTREGDTLFEIAAKKLGQASRYVDIMAKNDQRLPVGVNQSVPLQAGLRLVLPD
jgi:nucleoid-associated protein YgaU